MGAPSYRFWLPISFLFIGHEFAAAQITDTTKTHLIPEIVVTATRSVKEVNDIGRDVTVLPAAAIKNSGALDLAELLANCAGISVIGANQNPGMTQSVFMQGAASNQVLVMIDGIPVNDPSSTNNAIDLNELPLTDIEQVEIVRGSHSTLYGSSAIGGVINIITKKEQTPGLHVEANLLGGIFGKKTLQLLENIGLNYTFKSGWYAGIDLYNLNVNGLDATVDTSTASATFRSFDNDNFYQQRITTRLGYNHNKWKAFAAWNITHLAADFDKAGFKFRSYDIPTTLYDGDSTRIFTTRNFFSGMLHYSFNDHWDLQCNGGYSSFLRSTVDDSSVIDAAGTGDHTFTDGRYEGSALNLEAVSVYRWKYARLTAGAGYNRETMSSATHYFNSAYALELISNLDSLNINAGILNAFLQADIDGSFFSASLKDFNLVAGLRLNQHDLFGSTMVYEINPSFHMGNNALVFAAFTTGFKAPSLYQLYAPEKYYASGISRGNPELKPEYSQSAELGFKCFLQKNISFGATFYTTTVLHAIEYVYLWDKNIPIDQLGQDFYRDDYRGDTYINAGTQQSIGADAYLSIQFSNWLTVDANLSWVKGKLQYKAASIDTAHTEGNHIQLYNNGAFPVADFETKGLVRRPSTANLAATFSPFKKMKLRLSSRWTGSYSDIYYDNALGPYGALNTAPVNDYLLFDALLSCHLTEKMSTALKVENLLNTKYTEIRGFTTRGTGAYLTVSFSF